MTTVQHNPFSTRFTRPGEIPYLFTEPSDLITLVESFKRNRWVGQIVGPHGCGKTTLCHALASELCHLFPILNHVTIRSGREVHAMQLAGSYTLKPDKAATPKLTIVDGVERLSLLQQWMLISNLTQSKHIGSNQQDHSDQPARDALLITTHRQLKFVPVLRSIAPCLTTFENVARYLNPDLQADEQELAEIWNQAKHNTREAIMTLYDRHESLRTTVER